jgi:serine/threonine protein kinase
MLPGQILGDRYQIQNQLGKQTGRHTFLAQDLKTGTTVVVKLLIFNPDFEWTDLKLFERESETLKHLDCRSIPEYIDYFEVRNDTYQGFALVQSYIEAKSLKEQIETGRKFSESELQELAKSILGILIYLHGLNPPIIHRDLKPSNILLKDRSGHSIGNVYLIDFGSVQTVAQQEQSTLTIVGTYGYMPPEQFGGRTVAASDLYSLGATLIYLATGIHPADLPQKDGKIQLNNLANLSPAFVHWLEQLIEPSLEKRFVSAQAANQALNTLHEMQLTASNLEKPAGSRVQLQKSEEKIEISLLAKDHGFIFRSIGFIFRSIGFIVRVIVYVSLVAIALSFLSALLVPTVGAVSGGDWFFLLFSLPFWYVGLGMLFGLNYFVLIYSLKGKEIIPITIDSQGFLLTDKEKMARKINKLVIDDSYHTKDGDRVYVPMTLTIWAGIKKYTIGGRETSSLLAYLSEPEIEWLASELSQWLGIPITNRALNTLHEMQLTSSNLEKPAGSRVQLQKSEEKIKILLKHYSESESTGGFGCLIASVAWIIVFLVKKQSLEGFFQFLGSVTLVVSLFVVGGICLQHTDKIITIDSQEIVAIWRIFGWTLGETKMAREHINKLVIADSYYTKDSDGDRVYVPMALTIWAGTKEYTIGGQFSGLSEPEIEWLAAELSQWLGIPITNK